MTYERGDFLSTFNQMFTLNKSAQNMLTEDEHWKLSFPNEKSGPCYTYNSPFASEPGLEVGIWVKMKSDHWDPDLIIFLHDENKFFYTGNDAWNDHVLKLHVLEEDKVTMPKAKGRMYG